MVPDERDSRRLPIPFHHRLLAVINPVAGPIGSQSARKELEARARKSGIELDVVETSPELNGGEAVRSCPGDYDCILVLGGDGTVMEVASEALRRDIPVAILPRGTANAVAWHFGIPFDVGRAFRVAVAGQPLRIDVARSEHRDFLIMAGFGYDAHVIRSATRELKRRFGFLAYLFASLRNLGRQPYLFRIHLEDRTPIQVRGVAAIVANTGSLAGNIRAVSAISSRDGLLDVVVVRPAKFGSFFRMFALGVVGRLHEDPRVLHYQASRIKVEVRPRAPLEIDGDDIDGGPFRELEVEVLPRVLTLMVPPRGMIKVPWMPDVPWSPPLPKKLEESKESESG